MFRGLRDNVDFSDVTLACEDGKALQAHQVFLASSSSVFANMLKQNIHPKPIIYMRGVKMSNMSLICDFIYKGEAKVNEQDLNDFLNLAKDLQLEGLSDENVEMRDGTKKIVKKRKPKISKKRKSRVSSDRNKVKSSVHPDKTNPNMTNPLFEGENDDVKKFDPSFQFQEILPTENESESEPRSNVAFNDEADANPIDFDDDAKKPEKVISQQAKEQLDR